ncbi:MAG: hybrid sensor histidine kinase/response regulator [Bdellovibrionaceae bacterium]|nr:hybrid sensor histidine kinase/response regulator [Pseudobdellovibrionaceae bacterium]MDW8191255.1 hybrid sensor histidine kinase/response regulator [Pseudobdellovibrionaceae bacterium]
MPVRPLVVIIDDEVEVLNALERILEEEFQVLKFSDPEVFINQLQQKKMSAASVIICDQRMPKHQGVEVLALCATEIPQATRILLTGYADLDVVIQAINQGGIYRYLHKPWEPSDLIVTVREASRKHQLLEEAKLLEKAKTDFMILINHELKTPLTSILNFTHLLKDTSPLSYQQTHYLDRIIQSAERLQKLIDNTLLILKVEAKQLNPQITKVHPSQLRWQVAPEYQNLMQLKEINIHHNIGIDKFLVTDSRLLVLCLERLTENAIKFAHPKTTITFSITPTSPYRANIAIENEGPTVPPEILGQYGTPFLISQPILNHHQGAGLGLSVVVALLRTLNTQLKIENLHHGVRVSFELGMI